MHSRIRLGPVDCICATPRHADTDNAANDTVRGRHVQAAVGRKKLQNGTQPQDHTHAEGIRGRVRNEGRGLGNAT